MQDAARASWLAMWIVALAQILMSFNFFSLPVSVGGIVESFGASPSSVGTAIVTYSLFVAAFIMLGAKINARFGARRVFQISSGLFGLAMILMTFSPSAGVMILAQGLAGTAAAGLVPTLVILIATKYTGHQQAKALGYLGAAQAIAGVLAYLLAGMLGTWVGWRYTFGLLIVLAAIIVVFSNKLAHVEPQRNVQIDWFAVVLAASAIILLSFGFDFINDWGMLVASPGAPFSLFGLSPAALMIVTGVVIGQAFFVWTRRREASGKTPLVALEVLDTPQERAAIYLIAVVFGLGSAIAFLIPLYIQIVQGGTSLETAIATIPYTLAITVAAIYVVRLYDHVSPRAIARYSLIMQTIGLTLLAIVIRNDWSNLMVMMSLLIVGIAEGALVTLLFNVLVTASPKEVAGDVGSVRGTAINLSAGVGTAIATVLAVGLLSMSVSRSLASNPTIPPELQTQVDLDNIDFVSNDRLTEVMEDTTATPAQVSEAVAINTHARLQALKLSFLVLAGLAFLGIFPASGLPWYVPSEVPGKSVSGVKARRGGPQAVPS